MDFSFTNTAVGSANPFSTTLKSSKERLHLKLPQWLYPLLISLAVWRGLVMLSCVAIMIIPFYKGSASRKEHSWLIARRYSIQGSRIPYLVPNRSMVITLCEFFSNGMYFSLACINYLVISLKTYHVFSHNSYLGIWLAGWGLGYACLCNVKGSRRPKFARIFTPMVYNLVWISGSIIPIILMVYWASMTGHTAHSLENRTVFLFTLLAEAAVSWEKDHDLSKISLTTLFTEGQAILKTVEVLSWQLRQWGISWTILAIVVAFFYLFTAQYLLGMMKNLFLLRDTEKLTCREELGFFVWAELEKEFRFLFGSCVVICLALVCEVGAAIYQSLSSGHLDSVQWMTASAIIGHLPGIVISPCLLFQSWRIFTGRHAANEALFHEATSGYTTQELPALASQLLGWDTTVHWGHDTLLEVENFPGLRHLVENERSHIDDRISDPNSQNSPIKISITRSIVTANDTHHGYQIDDSSFKRATTVYDPSERLN
ncbi:hypothetical protein CROQUDRAFT_722325 [Cronartium quercuum f. sp. fusiforme G11]|uniref:Uncharacterized protein n=1 Tax=Cronartium quercuum f. sp. fusiforme G11 TaxID=708437 RepID=A0A9P6NNR7_9BASI|nr:hypothetical protein CROQUDRAFT_722325 [Cronartium quercuum f. sp. fusiforme G11]